MGKKQTADIARNQDIANAIDGVAQAIDRQTEYMREEDNKDVNTPGEVTDSAVDEVKNWARLNPSFDPNRDRQAMGMPTYGARGPGSRQRWQDEVTFEPRQLQLMQEIFHEFLSVARRFGEPPSERCRLCGLATRNPVHNIQLQEN